MFDKKHCKFWQCFVQADFYNFLLTILVFLSILEVVGSC